jgi:hypothetical protein
MLSFLLNCGIEEVGPHLIYTKKQKKNKKRWEGKGGKKEQEIIE